MGRIEIKFKPMTFHEFLSLQQGMRYSQTPLLWWINKYSEQDIYEMRIGDLEDIISQWHEHLYEMGEELEKIAVPALKQLREESGE
jgi:hypothetical protein